MSLILFIYLYSVVTLIMYLIYEFFAQKNRTGLAYKDAVIVNRFVLFLFLIPILNTITLLIVTSSIIELYYDKWFKKEDI